MNRLMITALSLVAALAFAAPTVQVTSADAAAKSGGAKSTTHTSTAHKTHKKTLPRDRHA
jgi:hypothetical protein